jgi:tetratricopeptide (TPR) repeat protein
MNPHVHPCGSQWGISAPGGAGWALTLAVILGSAGSSPGFDSSRQGPAPPPEAATARILEDYFEAFLRDQDLEAFQRSILARYDEEMLRQLAETGSPAARRAAILGLGLVGSMRSNATVGRALRDSDPTVRNLAVSALWSIWYRAGTPAQNEKLAEIRQLIARGRLREAEEQATRLIEEAPDFAEAHNQRAIAVCFQGRFADSAADCLKVLELNPYHIGALDGLAQCYLGLGDRARALEAYRRSLRLQPYNSRLRALIGMLQEDRE